VQDYIDAGKRAIAAFYRRSLRRRKKARECLDIVEHAFGVNMTPHRRQLRRQRI
jgi:hypothetical protein